MDAQMPRTTLKLEDDALKVANVYASRHRMSLGEAVSELVRQVAHRPLVTGARNGLQVVPAQPPFSESDVSAHREADRPPAVKTALLDLAISS
jgi:hypothetical protein